MLSIPNAPASRNTPPWLPLSSIVRNAAGKPIGRIFRRELAGIVEAATYSRWLGRYGDERLARAAIPKARARR